VEVVTGEAGHSMRVLLQPFQVATVWVDVSG